MPTTATPDTYEARLGSGGAWQNVTSRVWQAGRSWLYIVMGLQPETEYTLYLRASAGGNTSAIASVTATTLSRAIDYNARFCSDDGVNKLRLFGMDSPGNAVHTFQLFLNLFIGQSTSREREVFTHATIPNTRREVMIGSVATGERVYGNLLQVLDGNAVSTLVLQFIGGERLPACYPPPPESSSGDGSGSSGPYIPKPIPTPIHDTLNHLPPEIEVNNWVDGAQGRRVGLTGVGRADLIEGFLDAIDIWSHVTPGVQVCFAQSVRIVFLDAAYSPRQLVDLPEYSRDGRDTCTVIDRAGTVVLLQSASPPPPLPPAAPMPAHALSDCQVQPWADLNFRESPPDGAVIGVTSSRDWLSASETSAGYFKVSLWGRDGWISSQFVRTLGQCG